VLLVVVRMAALQMYIDYITIATTGNAIDFGDLTVSRYKVTGISNLSRGIFSGGTTGGFSNVMDYITICHNRKCY
jgi:hypothetical protein